MLAALALIVACGGDRPAVVVETDRSGHLFDRPFPSDELLDADGTVNLNDFPDAGTDLGTTFVRGWSRQAGETVMGWSHLAPIGVQFDGPIELPDDLDGSEGAPIRLVSLDSGHSPALEARFVADAAGDPFLVDNLLLLQPVPWDALRSGETYVLELDRKFADAEDAVTTFTVQDSVGQLEALRAATDAFLDADPALLDPLSLKRVTRISYLPGQSPSGKDATALTVTFDDDSTEVSYNFWREGLPELDIDLSDDPMEVWQATIRTAAFQDLADQPYGSPGVSFLGDFDRSDGWIAYDADGALVSPATADEMRVVIQLPADGSSTGLMTWDHGTGGQAYNAVQRINGDPNAPLIRAAFADAGVAIVSRDQPLYGTRYPLIDDGFGPSIGFYNIGNLPAWRWLSRQGAVDTHVLNRFAVEVLPDLFPGRVSTDTVGAFGHSLGSVTAHISMAMQQGDRVNAALMSGTGGDFTYYALDTGLLASDNDVVGLLGPLLGVELPDDPTGNQAVGALLGVPEDRWDTIDGLHPALGLFQLIMDPSDPLALAPSQVTPETVIMGIDDFQVPNKTTEWLVEATPESELLECQKLADYDGHHCVFREAEGMELIEGWLAATF